jgi:hypothetical protein
MQPAASHRLVYEATIDDALDVAIRLSRASEALQKQIRSMIVGTGVLGAAAFAGLWAYYSDSRTPLAISLAAAGSVVFGILFALMCHHFMTGDMAKRQRKLVIEQFRGKPAMPCEMELRPEGVWVRQAGIEITFPWTLCTAVHDHPDDVQIDFVGGIAVARNRHFASTDARRSFLDTARRLSAKS